MVVGVRWDPKSIDPVWLYIFDEFETRELIFNVYETLISFEGEKVDKFAPRLATNWSVSSDGLRYTFKIRQGVKFHDGRILTTMDVEYSFERILVMDVDEGPQWMLYEPLLDIRSANLTDLNFGSKIDNAIQCNETHVWFNLAKPYTPFMPILCQPWFSIINKGFCLEHGDWPGTWDSWQQYHDPEVSPLDSPEPAMCGTGPYMFDYWQKGVEWSIIKFDEYWRGWPATQTDTAFEQRSFVATVTAKFIPDPNERKSMFLTGQLDTALFPRNLFDDLAGQPGIRCVYPLTTLCASIVVFNYNVTNALLPHGTFDESGIPPDFFSDPDLRRGFAYSFNYAKYIEETFMNEALQPATIIIEGLPYQNPTQEKYFFAPQKAMEYFQKAWGGKVWQNGFNITLVYFSGFDTAKNACTIFKTNVESLNPKFHAEIKELIGVVQFPLLRLVPMYLVTWSADYPDPHNFVEEFMLSDGYYGFMHPSNTTIDTLIEDGLRTSDPERREDIYYALQRIYYDQAFGVPLAQPLERHWERDWVQGWYYNPAYQCDYFYLMWKGYHGDINGDGKVDLLDIYIVAAAFGSRQGDPRWNALADLDKNGIINIVDVFRVAKEFGKKLTD